MDRSKTPKFSRTIRAAFLLFGLAGCICMGRWIYQVAFPPVLPLPSMPFSSQLWRNHEELAGNARITMVEDLLSRHIHAGMFKGKVEDLLGKPTHEGREYLRHQEFGGKQVDYQFTYCVGQTFGGWVQIPVLLNLYFDIQGRLLGTEVIEYTE